MGDSVLAFENLDDDRAGEIARASRGRVWTYSLENPKAHFLAEDVRLSLDGTRFREATGFVPRFSLGETFAAVRV